MAGRRVNTKEPFELVYSLYQHPQLGFLLEIMAVQLIANGGYSLSAQKLHHVTAADFGADEESISHLKILDETEPENLIKKFYTGKKAIRAGDFFGKYYTEEMHAKVRPFVERRMLKVLMSLGDKKLFLAKDTNVTHSPVVIENEKASILFHFRRNEEGTNYFATIKLGDEKISFSQNQSELIIQEPAWLLYNNRLITFRKDTDGNKIKPFLHKKFISILPKNEAVYFEKFVRPLIESYDVYAEGFDIISEKHRAVPILKLTKFSEDDLCAALYFNYGPYQFPYHSDKLVSVSLEKKLNNYIFHRIRRSKDWENKMTSKLEEMGLKVFEGSLFTTIDRTQNLVEIFNKNKALLDESGFKIDQSQLKRVYFIGESDLKLNVSKDGDWFDLHAEVQFGEHRIPFMRLKGHILKGEREFELPDGSIAIIPEEWFNRFSGIFDFSQQNSDHFKLKTHHFGLLEEVMGNDSGKAPQFNPDKENSIPKGLKATLRPYQLTGYNWLIHMSESGFGACLSDDMGLGKTLQVLAYLQHQKENTKIDPRDSRFGMLPTDLFNSKPVPVSHGCSLIIVPTSLIYNWVNEIKKFTHLKAVVHSGFNRKKSIDNMTKNYDLIISSYGTVRNDIQMFSKFKFENIVLDESQAIKNPSSQTAVSVNQLQAEHKIVMTGTPVENSITDLWSQFNFINPGILGNYNFFTRKYVTAVEKDKNEEQTQRLRSIVEPFILRRTKEQVAKDLPQKTEKIVYCQMSQEQKQQYDTVKSGFRNEILESIIENGFQKSNMMILNGLIKLRQIANHPVLADAGYKGDSGKFEQITLSLIAAMNGGHKILVFSQFVQHLELLKKFLVEENIQFQYLTGQVPSNERQKMVDHFQNDDETRLFLISLKAGGSGLNLTSADYVFLLDPWWNPAVEKQAMDRTHRIGQTKPVFVYKFISKDTIEEKIVRLQAKKQKVSDDILDTETQFVQNLEEDTLKNLLD